MTFIICVLLYLLGVGAAVRIFMKIAEIKTANSDELVGLVVISVFWPISLTATIGYQLLDKWMKAGE